jgi:ABC-type nitrate/sulfonate/bicarbonate transport system permease component
MSEADRPPLRGGVKIGWPRIALPIMTLAFGVVAWDLVVRVKDIPPFILPGPGLVAATVVSDWPVLWDSLLVTLATTFYGLALALAGGVGLAILFNQSRLIEHSLYPYAVILQVTSSICRSRRRCWLAPGSWRSFRSSPTPPSGSTRSIAIS